MKFQYTEMHNHYYHGRHAVDDNNNNRQGCLSFEEAFGKKDWEMRQFGFIVALCQTNAYLAYNYFRDGDGDGTEKLSKAQFVRELADEMINNSSYVKAKKWREEDSAQCGGKRKSRGEVQHELVRISTGHGKWDGSCFPSLNQLYQKYVCSTKTCPNRIRTYCSCNKYLMLCGMCWAVHLGEQYTE